LALLEEILPSFEKFDVGDKNGDEKKKRGCEKTKNWGPVQAIGQSS
jgi:hypothetical protein